MAQQTTTKTDQKDLVRVISSQDLGFSVEHKKAVNPVGFSLWIRSLLQNWRQGTVGCKGRSDVNRSNKKPWKQKGTGRARAGSARSPLWRGGGVIFGPQPRTRTLTVPQEAKRGILNTLLFSYLEQGKIVSMDWLVEDKPKTAAIYARLKEARLHKDKVTVFVSPDDLLTYASFANIPNIRIVFFDQVNAYDLADGRYWLFLNKNFDHFKKMALQWI